eukprot:9022621-Pyramimonas_sp.AAC.1
MPAMENSRISSQSSMVTAMQLAWPREVLHEPVRAQIVGHPELPDCRTLTHAQIYSSCDQFTLKPVHTNT